MNKQATQEAFIMRYIKGTPGALYDIGVGPKSEYLTLGEAYPEMRLCGCEPLLRLYGEDFRLKFNGTLLSVAISDEPGEVPMYYKEENLLNASMLNTNSPKKLMAPAITLDAFDEYNKKPDRILLWADIEGMEYRMLKSGPEILESGRVKWINLEEHSENTKQNQKIDALLASFGYKRACEYNKHPRHHDVIYVHESENPQ